ncbi:MAG: hydrogenobyrinic acid a,c-diamide synthase (glutamine-hydrolyzing), partial [Caldimicrobium sp.]
LGLITSYEEDIELIAKLKEKVKDNIDLNLIIKIAKEAPDLRLPIKINDNIEKLPVKIGVFNDPAFQFYYPENLEMLTSHGAKLIFINALKENKIPNDLDGLYLGGGFPELYADILAENESLKRDLRYFVKEGMPVYAECGGLMFLGEEIEWQEKKFPMAGVLSIKFKISKKPFGHGYVIAKVIKNNPFYPHGDIIKGHEFHYSYPVEIKLRDGMNFVFQLEKGVGFNGKVDGIHYKNLFASFTHIHVFGVKYWASNFVKLAYYNKFNLNNSKEVQDV